MVDVGDGVGRVRQVGRVGQVGQVGRGQTSRTGQTGRTGRTGGIHSTPGRFCGLGEVDGSLEGSGVRADVIRNGHPTPVA